ncbi:GtrA family protein [Streptococcus cameli]
MKQLKKIITNEIFLYLVFGVATTVVYMVSRSLLFKWIPSIEVVVLLANSIAIAFAFVTNDSIVFNQQRTGWQKRFVKFLSARLATLVLDIFLAFLLVRAYPHLIGQFVQGNPEQINFIAGLIAQVLVIVANYVLSKLFVFNEKQPHLN